VKLHIAKGLSLPAEAVTHACQRCGMSFSPSPTQLKRGQGKFCSISCASRRARFCPPAEERFWAKVDKGDGAGCWLWTGALLPNGYGSISIGARSVLVHRFAYELQNGSLGSGQVVCHRCDVKLCVRGDHLFAGSHADNVADRDAKGHQATGDRNGARKRPERLARGEGHGNAKLTAEMVSSARRRRKGGESIAALAREFEVSDQSMASALHGYTWRHVQESPTP
jgi:hypothetical protein